MYADYEIKCNLPRRAIAVYQRALSKIQNMEDLYAVYKALIKIVAEKFGIVETREIYQQGLENLDDFYAIKIGLEFVAMESQLGEIERARVILAYTSQMCNPKLKEDFWQQWQDFEVQFGNEDTVREMLRIKRSIEAKFSGAYAGFVSSTIGKEGQTVHTEGNFNVKQNWQLFSGQYRGKFQGLLATKIILNSSHTESIAWIIKFLRVF